MNDTNDTISSLNKTEDQTLAFIEENFNQTYNNGGNFSLTFHSFLISKPTFWSLQIYDVLKIGDLTFKLFPTRWIWYCQYSISNFKNYSNMHLNPRL